MTEQEKQLANSIYEWFNDIQKQKGNEVSRAINGYDILTSESYFPIMVAGMDVHGFENVKLEPENMKVMYRPSSPQSASIFKARVKSSAPIILEDCFEVLTRSNELMSRYIGLAKPLSDAKSILGQLEREMRERGLGEYYDNLKHYVDALHGGRRLSTAERIFKQFYSLYVQGKLGLGAFVALKQLPSYMLMATEMDMDTVSKYYTKGMNLKINDYLEDIQQHSPQLWARWQGMISRDIGELRKQSEARRLFSERRRLADYIMRPVTIFDSVACSQIWNTVKAEAADKFEVGSDEYWNFITHKAEKVIRRTQPTFHIKDRAALQAPENELARPFTSFMSQRIKIFNIVRRGIKKMGMKGKRSEGAKEVITALAIQGSAIIAIDMLRNKLMREPEKDKDKETLNFMRTIVSNMVGNLPVIGKFVDMFLYRYRKVEMPLYGTINDARQSITKLYSIMTREYKYSYQREEAYEQWLTKDLPRILSNAGIPTKIFEEPYNMIKRATED